jgi:hypothetical protein
VAVPNDTRIVTVIITRIRLAVAVAVTDVDILGMIISLMIMIGIM